ncbi:hypothetical protein MHB40_15130 [Lysinibacillus sp. FSL K6-0057]|uniref:hypothetical protein n=1 Tax=Lysinibacillus sp. FSL K6-0057 TaxID=2921411 RepID=UPI00315ACD45
MKNYKKVKGTQNTVKDLEVNIDTVYVRNNIIRIDEEDFKGWEYDETQYSKDEYHEMIGGNAKSMKSDVNDVADVTSTLIEDNAMVADLLATLIQQNAELEKRVKSLEGGA